MASYHDRGIQKQGISPSIDTIVALFGSWNEAIKKALNENWERNLESSGVSNSTISRLASGMLFIEKECLEVN